MEFVILPINTLRSKSEKSKAIPVTGREGP
jgi:hypothetical protein